jgi:hypothetical protein
LKNERLGCENILLGSIYSGKREDKWRGEMRGNKAEVLYILV